MWGLVRIVEDQCFYENNLDDYTNWEPERNLQIEILKNSDKGNHRPGSMLWYKVEREATSNKNSIYHSRPDLDELP